MTGLLIDPKGLARRVGRPPRDDDHDRITGTLGKPKLDETGDRYAVCAMRSPYELAGFDDIHEALKLCRVIHGRVYRRSDGALLAWARRVSL